MSTNKKSRYVKGSRIYFIGSNTAPHLIAYDSWLHDKNMRGAGDNRKCVDIYGSDAIEASTANYTGVRLYPEHCYNNIKSAKELGINGKVSKTFVNKANLAKYDDIGLNVKNGFAKTRTHNWEHTNKWDRVNINNRLTIDREYRIGLDVSSPIMNLDIKELPLMIDKNKLGKGIKTPFDLIYGKTDKDVLVGKGYNNYSYSSLEPYHYNDKMSRHPYYSIGISGIYYKRRKGTKKGSSLCNTIYPYAYNSTSANFQSKFVYACDYYGLERIVKYVDISWTSIREASVALVPASGKKISAITDLKITRADGSMTKFTDNLIPVNEHHWQEAGSGPYSGANYHTRVGSINYPKSWRGSPVIPQCSLVNLYHFERSCELYPTESLKDRDGKAMPQKDFMKNASGIRKSYPSIGNDLSERFNNTNEKNINYIVFIHMIYAKVEELSIIDPTALSDAKYCGPDVEDKITSRAHSDFSRFFPELTPVGKQMMLSMVKTTVLNQMNITTRTWRINGSTEYTLMSNSHVEYAQYLSLWLVDLFIHCDFEDLKDKDFFPYFNERPKDQHGNVLETIRLDIGRGRDCSFIVPKMDLILESDTNKTLKNMDSDKSLSMLFKYMTVINPLLKDMDDQKVLTLDYCYPVISLCEYAVPELYEKFNKIEIPELVYGLDTDVNVLTLRKISYYLRDVILKDDKNPAHPDNFQRRSMLKETGLWKDLKSLDFSKVKLPKLGIPDASGESSYEVLKEGKLVNLSMMKVGDKLNMLQHATDLINNIPAEKKDAISVIHDKYIAPIIKSIKLDNSFNEKEFSGKIDEMMKLKGKLDFMRDIDLSYLRRRKETLVQLFNGQRKTLKRVLDEDKLSQEKFLKGMVSLDPKMEELEKSLVVEIKTEDEEIDSIQKNHDEIAERRSFKVKATSTAIVGLTVGAIYKAIKAIRNKKDKR